MIDMTLFQLVVLFICGMVSGYYIYKAFRSAASSRDGYPTKLVDGVRTTSMTDVHQWEIRMRQRLATQAESSHYGHCYCCGLPWWAVDGHDTKYSVSHGCFPLCEKCWTALETPEARLPYYRQMFNKWPQDHADWNDIEAAVLHHK